jgi:Flp pilus assembly protein TadG
MKSSTKCRGFKSARRPKGAAVLEMALVLPVLIMLSLGVVSYGYLIYLKNTFQGVAQAGARAAIPSTATNSTVTGTTGIITTMMTASGIPAANYTVTLNPTDVSAAGGKCPAGTPITVTISATWGNVGVQALPTCFGGINSSQTITCFAVMYKEN